MTKKRVIIISIAAIILAAPVILLLIGYYKKEEKNNLLKGPMVMEFNRMRDEFDCERIYGKPDYYYVKKIGKNNNKDEHFFHVYCYNDLIISYWADEPESNKEGDLYQIQYEENTNRVPITNYMGLSKSAIENEFKYATVVHNSEITIWNNKGEYSVNLMDCYYDNNNELSISFLYNEKNIVEKVILGGSYW